MEAPRDSSSGAPVPAPAGSENTAQRTRDSLPSEQHARKALANIDLEIELDKYIGIMKTLWGRAQDKQPSSASAEFAAEVGTESCQQIKASVLASMADQLPANGQKTYPLISTGASRFSEAAKEWIELAVADVLASGGQSVSIDFLVYTYTLPKPEDPHNHALVRVWVSGKSTGYTCRIGHVHKFAPKHDFELSKDLPKYLEMTLAKSLGWRNSRRPESRGPKIQLSTSAENEGKMAPVHSHMIVPEELKAWGALAAIDHFIRRVDAAPSDASATKPSRGQKVSEDLRYYLKMAMQLVGGIHLLQPHPATGGDVIHQQAKLGRVERRQGQNRDDEHLEDVEVQFSCHYYKTWATENGILPSTSGSG